MRVLRRAPFFLPQGALIDVIAFATNALGAGPPSDTNTTGAFVQAEPLAMRPPAPQPLAYTVDSMTLEWRSVEIG